MNSRNKKDVIVVVHDAGGAELVGAYIRKNQGRCNWYIYGAGPARKIFRRLRLPLRSVADDPAQIAAIMKTHRDAAFALIAAPGWMSKIEIRALASANKAGIRTVVYKDSWVDERRRFKKTLPKEFWVGDQYALHDIREQFPHIPAMLVTNEYIAGDVRRYRSLRKALPKKRTILFLSDVRPESQTLLQALLVVMAATEHPPHLLVRFHPADVRTRYDGLIRTYDRSVHIHRSREKDVVRDLVRAHVVVGAETAALALAVSCGIPTVSLVQKKKRAMLPFKEILSTHDPQRAASHVLALVDSRTTGR